MKEPRESRKGRRESPAGEGARGVPPPAKGAPGKGTGGVPRPVAGIQWNRTHVLLFLILALAAFLRCYQITNIPPGLYHDEAMNGNDAQENLETGRFQVFYPENGGREGLYINLVTPLVYLFGSHAWVLRIPAVIFGILTILGIYLLASELFSKPVGLLAAFFLATSFWHLNFSRIGLRAIGSPLFLAWGLWLLLVAIRRVCEGRPDIRTMVLAGVVYALGFYTYLVYRATPILPALILIYYFREARRLWWIYGVAAAATVVPLALYFVQHPGSFFGRASEVSIFRMPSPFGEFMRNIWKLTQMIFIRGDFNWRHNIAWRPVVFWPVAILFAVGVGIGIYAIYRRKPDWFGYAIALGWLIAAALPAALSSEGMPHALRSLLMAPAIFVLAAAAAHRVYAMVSLKAPERWMQVGAAGVLLALSYQPFHDYFDVWAREPKVAEAFNRSAVEIAERINALPFEVPKYVIAVEAGVTGGLPAPAQTIMFLTGSYTKKQQERTNIRYLTRQSANDPEGVAFCQQVAAPLTQGQVFCLQVNRESPPVF